MKGKVHTLTVDSRALASNRLGDPAAREVLVYTPEVYDSASALPMVMILPAYGSNHRTFLNYDLWKPSVLEQLDDAMSQKRCDEAILVFPDCRTRWGGSQFVDSPATGRYQSFLADEVIPAVDEAFRTIGDRSGRAVVGRSSGGFGALRLGMDRPQSVAAVASIAGDAAFDISLRPLLLKAQLAFERAGGVEQFCARLAAEGPGRSSDYDGAFVVAAATAYAPHTLDVLPYAPMALDSRTAELDGDVWSAWKRADPCERIEQSVDALRSLRLVYLEAGRFDEYGMQFAARIFARRSASCGVQVQYAEFDGGHRGTRARYLDVIPRLVRSLSN